MSVNLNSKDELAEYYRGIHVGSQVAIPGAAGLGSGISHYVYRVPKNIYNAGPTRSNVRKMKENKYKAMIAAQAAERAAANVVRKDEMNANVASITYTDEPMSAVDIDSAINLLWLADKGKELATKILQKRNENTRKANPRARRGMIKKKVYVPTVDESIQELHKAFIETERNKVRGTIQTSVKRNIPNWPTPFNMAGVRRRNSQQKTEIEKRIQEHLDRKMPKIDSVIEKVREGMILGFPTPASKAAAKEVNLLRFNNLSSINFSAPNGSSAAGSGAPVSVDPFEGLGGKRKTRKAKRNRRY